MARPGGTSIVADITNGKYDPHARLKTIVFWIVFIGLLAAYAINVEVSNRNERPSSDVNVANETCYHPLECS